MRKSAVLLISPFDEERAMYSEYLQVQGFDVVEQREPSHAIATVSGQAIGAVVAHVRQNGPVDGIALTRALRRELGNSVAVLLLSTAIDPVVRARALAANCDRFLLVPCAPEELVREIRMTFGERP